MRTPLLLSVLASLLLATPKPAPAQSATAHQTTLQGAAAYGDWRSDAPGVRRHLTPDDLPRPFANRSASNTPSVIPPPPGALPKVPPGFAVQRFATGLDGPRLLRVAPNGDIFVAETYAGRIRLLRATDGATQPSGNDVVASGLTLPFGIAFYPPGPDPHWVYVAQVDSIIRFPYAPGAPHPIGPPETVVPKLASGGGHITRDVQFSRDGTRMFVSIGSASNVAESLPRRSQSDIEAWEAQHGLGAAWGNETDRADVLSFRPDGQQRSTFATGLRNCVGLATHPTTADLWCATNERDGLGDNLPPDYITRVREGAFFGWPWYYIGNHDDPRHLGARPDLAGRATTPDVLVQPHSAPLQITFYPRITGPAAFPTQFQGDAFVALHGSWNRATRTGYKVVRIPLQSGVPTGEYEDFLTGFVRDNDSVWGRPVGVAVAHDGALLVTDDANNAIWRVSPLRP